MTVNSIDIEVRPLRWLADNYVQIQRMRVRIGEQIRAVLQGRDTTFERAIGEIALSKQETSSELRSILDGETDGPVPLMGRAYRRYFAEEREVFAQMLDVLDPEPGWYWLQGVRGIGPTLGCYLLGLIDIRRARHASSLWKFAGLATVPGLLYRCSTCGLEKGFPVDWDVTGKHQALGGTKRCRGALEVQEGVDIRVAEPKTARSGEKRPYNNLLKSKVYLCATAFLKAGGPYEEFYRTERAKAEVERPRWADGGKHYLALRKTQKLFLSHLWETWREAEGLPTSEHYALALLGHDDKMDPWNFTESERR